MREPFFSIVIPTFNRCQDLQLAIKAILEQDYKDFELIISDNASTDSTKETVESFNDSRIKYFKNRKNIGAEKNYQKTFSYAKGNYIFSQGDDDFILFGDTLSQIKKILDKKEYGLLRLNLLEKELVGKGLRKSFIRLEKDKEIKKGSGAKKIINFFNQIAAGHLAGLVIKNVDKPYLKINDFQEVPWIRLIYENTKRYSAYFLAKNYMVVSWSQGAILSHYQPHADGRLMFEKYTDYIFPLYSPRELLEAKWNFYKNFIFLQPAAKLYSSNKNLIIFNRRLFQLEPRLKNNLKFWIFFFMALTIPKFIWQIIRLIQHKRKNYINRLENLDVIINRFSYWKTETK